MAQDLIVSAATAKISDRDIILTYSFSYVVERVLLVGREKVFCYKYIFLFFCESYSNIFEPGNQF